ncbi:Diacylglycerol lipase-beta, partial [Plecturocebus cupreus]
MKGKNAKPIVAAFREKQTGSTYDAVVFQNGVSLLLPRLEYNGTICNPGPRKSMSKLLYIRLALFFPEMVWASLGATWVADGVQCDKTVVNGIIATVVVSWIIIAATVVSIVIVFDPLGGKMAPYSSAGPSHLDSHDSSQLLNGLKTAATSDTDLVPSDIAAGLTLLHQQQDNIKNSQEPAEVVSHSPGSLQEADLDAELENCHHYMQFAAAAYGWPLYVYRNPLTGLCKIGGDCCRSRTTDYDLVGGDQLNCHFGSILQTTGLQYRDFIHVSFHDKVYELPFLVALDHRKESVIVAVRGTMSMQNGQQHSSQHVGPPATGAPRGHLLGPLLPNFPGPAQKDPTPRRPSPQRIPAPETVASHYPFSSADPENVLRLQSLCPPPSSPNWLWGNAPQRQIQGQTPHLHLQEPSGSPRRHEKSHTRHRAASPGGALFISGCFTQQPSRCPLGSLDARVRALQPSSTALACGHFQIELVWSCGPGSQPVVPAAPVGRTLPRLSASTSASSFGSGSGITSSREPPLPLGCALSSELAPPGLCYGTSLGLLVSMVSAVMGAPEDRNQDLFKTLDILTDLSAESEVLDVECEVQDRLAHKVLAWGRTSFPGISQAARYVYQRLIHDGILSQAFSVAPEYRLVIVGHSLGGGAAALLATMLRAAYPQVRCYAFAPPRGLW